MRGPRLLLVVLLLAAFTLTTIELAAPGPFEPVRGVVDRVLGPPRAALASGARAVGGLFGSEGDPGLAAENDRLRGELATSQELQRRVDELDALLALRDQGSYPMVPARVVAVGSAFGFGRTVTIDAGSLDGLAEGQTVVTGAGLVGRTTRVGPVSSTVLLLVDRGFSVGARLTREGTVGLATGQGQDLSFQLVEGERLAAGEALLTSGSSTFVPGVPVGRVVEVQPAEGSLVATARVEPFVDVSALDLVGVITEPPRATPRVRLEPGSPLPVPSPS